MKRLAIGVVAVVMGLTVTATAAPPSNGRGPQRACWQRAETLVRTGVDDYLYVDVGVDARQPAPRAFVCYMGPDTGDGTVAGVFSAWVDPEYGRVGYSCAKRRGWVGIPCDYQSLKLPGDATATTPVDHPYGPWGFHVLGLDVGYAFDSTQAAVALDTPEECAGRMCFGAKELRASARRGLQYRALGWKCTADDAGTCEQYHGPTGVTVGEQDEEPTLSIGPLDLDVPAACVEASTDVRC